ncbi:pentapeptide repeat-containing protein [Aeromicrobium duanguangcaii]|uniref:pentapeptide repeat-containing protein n=1 Tax=Aeromicrobium duanguangcaii TaxID=2968086 RepID=UPI0034E2863D
MGRGLLGRRGGLLRGRLLGRGLLRGGGLLGRGLRAVRRLRRGLLRRRGALGRARLGGAGLRRARLRGARLRRARLRGARLRGAGLVRRRRGGRAGPGRVGERRRGRSGGAGGVLDGLGGLAGELLGLGGQLVDDLLGLVLEVADQVVGLLAEVVDRGLEVVDGDVVDPAAQLGDDGLRPRGEVLGGLPDVVDAQALGEVDQVVGLLRQVGVGGGDRSERGLRQGLGLLLQATDVEPLDGVRQGADVVEYGLDLGVDGVGDAHGFSSRSAVPTNER